MCVCVCVLSSCSSSPTALSLCQHLFSSSMRLQVSLLGQFQPCLTSVLHNVQQCVCAVELFEFSHCIVTVPACVQQQCEAAGVPVGSVPTMPHLSTAQCPTVCAVELFKFSHNIVTVAASVQQQCEAAAVPDGSVCTGLFCQLSCLHPNLLGSFPQAIYE